MSTKSSITDQDRINLALQWQKCGCIEFGSFKLKLHEKDPDAPLSPFYLNFRKLRSFPIINEMSATALRYLIRDNGSRPDYIADVPTAATPLATAMSIANFIPLISPRKELKEYGSSDSVDGVYEKGGTVMLVDDLITKADSKLEAIKKLEAVGLKVLGITTLVDREQGGVKTLEDMGYKVYCLYQIRPLLSMYMNKNVIDREKYETCIKYLDLYS